MTLTKLGRVSAVTTPQGPRCGEEGLESRGEAVRQRPGFHAGSGFDRAYIDQEVAAHRAVKDLLERSEGEADNPDLKAVIGKARSVVDRHLKEAEELQQKLAEKA